MRIGTAHDLGACIRNRRRTLGLTQDDLARRVGASRRWIAALEAGKSTVELHLVLRTLAALGLAADVREAGPTPGTVDLDAHPASLDQDQPR